MSNARNLNESRAEALQALDRVSDRLGEILGEIPGDGTHRNEHGELVNEEGLPIIDITEPLDDLDTPSLSAATEDEAIEEDNYPEPISYLSPDALSISRKHRDKILDLLEEEETREERRTRQEQQAELLRKRDAARNEMQKRMESQGAQLEKRRRAKELERKMAKALVGGLGDLEPTAPSKDANQKEKKSVTFAEAPSALDASSSHPKLHAEATTWGDIVPGRLTGKQRVTSRSRTQPMKMEVIERSSGPSQPPSGPDPPLPELLAIHKDQIGDSDDESDAEEHSDSTLAVESGEEDVVLSAHHHRDLALEYHRRREALASGVGTIKPEEIGLGVSVNSNDWGGENVPLGATVAHAPPRPVSKFKAESANPGSKNLGPTPETHLPAPSTFGTAVLPPIALAKSVKMGKLVDGNLVAGYEEDDEYNREAREEEEIRKLLLQSMENYSDIAAQIMGPTGSYWADSKAEEADSTPQQAKRKPRVSRFKVNRSQSRDPSESTTKTPENSHPPLKKIHPSSRPGSTTPPSNAGRSSPKATQREGPAALKHAQVASPDMARKIDIDPPSFAPRHVSPLRNTSSTSDIVDSPSFRNHTDTSPGPISTVIKSPTFASPALIIESPSFMRPPLIESQHLHVRNSEQICHNEREPGTMANNVIERSTNRNSSVTAGVAKSQRISRFKAERGSM